MDDDTRAPTLFEILWDIDLHDITERNKGCMKGLHCNFLI